MNLTQIQQGFEDREFSSQELTGQYLARIKKFNPRLNVFLTVTKQLALDQAKAADQRRTHKKSLGLLDGVPCAIKDLICLKDYPTTAGSKILENFIPSYDATVIERLKAAGAVILGKVNLDEFAHGSSTENSAYGVTKNPWDETRVPGGSSGGSAAAVAADLAPVALGSDTGGSIRQPAALTGITGFKPTYGAVSRRGLIAMASSLDQIGPMTETAEDTLAMMKLIAGPDCYDGTTINLKFKALNSLKGLKVGLPQEYFTKDLDSDIKQAVEKAAQVLARAGAFVRSVSLPHTPYALAVYYIIQPVEVASNLARFDGVHFGKTRDKLGPEARRRIILGTFTSSAGYADKYYLQAQKVRSKIKEDYDQVFNQVDILLAATSPTPAFKIGEKVQDPLKMYLSDVLTVPVNLAGLPAVSVSCGLVKRGGKDLPVGLQIIGNQRQDSLVLEAARGYQRLTDWHNLKPKLN